MTLSGELGPTVIETVEELRELAGEHGDFIADLYTTNGGNLASDLRNPTAFQRIVGEAVGANVYLVE